MPISEFVIGTLRPDVAQEGLSHIRQNQPKIFSTVPGSLSNNVGQIIKHNGKDVTSAYKPILALEWDNVATFHAFYPASDAFQAFMGVFKPYAAAKAQPQLFTPLDGSSTFKDLFTEGVTQLFIAPAAAGKQEELSAKWVELLKTVEKGDAVGKWSGWGIETDEGTWAGVVGWKSLEGFERSATDASVIDAVQKLKKVAEVDEYVVAFAQE